MTMRLDKKASKKYKKFKLGLTPQQTIFYGFLTYITAGFLILCLPFLQNKPIGFIDHLFTAASAVSTLLLIMGILLVSYTSIFMFENILFEVASALGTVGLSTGITGELDTFGKTVLIVLMFIGQLGLLTFGLPLWYKEQKNDSNLSEVALAL